MAGRSLASLSGLVFVVLAVVGSLLIFDGPSDSSPPKMTAYYGSSTNRWHINLGWILTGLALFALIWFVAALRERIRASELAASGQGTFLSTIVLVGGTVYIAVAMAAIALEDGVKTMSDDTYQHRVYSGVIHAANDATYIMVVTGGAALAALIFAVSVAVRRYAILPSWVGWFGFAAGVAAIFSVIFFTMLFWLLWIAVASVTLFLAARSETRAAPRTAAAPTS